MSSDTIRVLLVEDDQGDADLLSELLELVDSSHFQVTHCRRLSEALQSLCQACFDVILLDLSLPDSHGLGTVDRVYNHQPTIPIVILSGLEDESLAIEAVQAGAQDYLVKGQAESDGLVRAIHYAIERAKILQLLNEKEKQLQIANENLEQRVEERTSELKQANEQLRGLEAQLRKTLAQEKELSQLKSRIITTISHEYRTPLTTILSSAELLEVYRHQWNDEKQLKYFRRIHDTVKHMTALVNDVLFLNQAESEKVNFNPEPINLIDFFTELIGELKSPLDNKYNLVFENIGNCIQCYIDANLVRQILANLLSNAFKYSPNGGTVSLQLNCEQTRVIFQITDEGIGIPDEDKQKLFEAFSRASNVSTIQGTGLGLSIVKKCVDLHGGQISLKSEVGVGTTFTVNLPQHPEEDAPLTPGRGDEERGKYREIFGEECPASDTLQFSPSSFEEN
ncbi:MAG: response regulator [Coleofasciculus sp. Co-bin14]|nr:response regulator [Coleofasciculus sp. Co-bin14]